MTLFRRKPLVADLATGDWTPVPSTAVARPADPVSWLTEDLAARTPRPGPAALPRGVFSPEELAIIEEQRRLHTPSLASQSPPAPVAVQPHSCPIAESLIATASVEPAPATPVRKAPLRPEREQPAASETASRPTWIEVLKAYAEHLTDAELRILRQQLQS